MAEINRVLHTLCTCGDTTHTPVFGFSIHPWSDDDVDTYFIINTNLNHFRPWWKRLWVGVKYTLGVDNTYYHYAETLLDKEEVVKLKEFIDKALEDWKDEQVV